MYLTFHKNKNKAICHHCSMKKKYLELKDKKNCDFIMYGPGVEKIFEEVIKFFLIIKLKFFRVII